MPEKETEVLGGQEEAVKEVKEEPQYAATSKYSNNFFINTFYVVKEWIEETRIRTAVFRILCIGIGSIYVGSCLAQNITNKKIYFDPVSVIYILVTSSLAKGLTVIFATVLIVFFYKFFKIKPKRKHDSRKNMDISESNVYGGTHIMEATEKAETFDMIDKLEVTEKEIEGTKKLVANMMGDILGIDPESKKLCSRKIVRYSNRNEIIIGQSGCGKSVCKIIPDILQHLLRGHSFIVTDSKGDLYNRCAYICAKIFKFKVKVLNLKPNELLYSDSFNAMKIINGDASIADTIATVIMVNTTDGDKKDFWYTEEYNLLKAFILVVAMSTDLKPEEKTLGKVYELLITMDLNEIKDYFAPIVAQSAKKVTRHPAADPFEIFNKIDDKQKGNITGGLAIRLGTFSDAKCRKIVSEDDIDLRLPAKEKCAYFVIISDQDKSRNFIATLFFTLLFIELIDEVDSEMNGVAKVPVTFLLDEYKSTGSIPAMDDKMAIIRSRDIAAKLVVQDLNQLADMHPNNAWRTIMNNCSTKMLISTDDSVTADYFTDLCGTQTAVLQQKRYAENAMTLDTLKGYKGEYEIGESLNKCEVMSHDDIYHLAPEQLLICISHKNPIILNKFNYFEYPHPLAANINGKTAFKLTEIKTHRPIWWEEKDRPFTDMRFEFKSLRVLYPNGIPEDVKREMQKTRGN